MTAQEHPFPRVESLINTFAGWLRHRRDLSEIRRMDTTEFDRIAGDLRVSPGDLTKPGGFRRLSTAGSAGSEAAPSLPPTSSDSRLPKRCGLSAFVFPLVSSPLRGSTQQRRDAQTSTPAPTKLFDRAATARGSRGLRPGQPGWTQASPVL